MKSVLSIDGGGMKGYIPCAVLVELEHRAGKPCSEMFDMVAGTSIGGILACCIATGLSATDSLKFFTEDGPKIFGHQRLLGKGGILMPRYDAEPLETALKDRLEGATLSTTKKALLVPAFDLKAYSPYFFKSTKFDKDYLLWQVARATSAAQTYFPAYELDDMVLWDGGNVANNPCACAVAEAIKIWGHDEPLRVLSLGCGATASKYPVQKLVNAGLATIGIETMSLLFDTNDELPDYMLKRFMPDGYFRVQPNLTMPLGIDGADPHDIDNLKIEANWAVIDFGKTLSDFLAFTK